MNQAVVFMEAGIDGPKCIQQVKWFLSENHHLLEISIFCSREDEEAILRPGLVSGVALVETENSFQEMEEYLKKLEEQMGKIPKKNLLLNLVNLKILIWNGKIMDPEVHEKEALSKAILEVLPQFTIS